MSENTPDHTVLGLPILNPGPDGIPLDALVIAKYLDEEDGNTSHRFMFTSNLDVVDVLGRLHWAILVIEEGLLDIHVGGEDAEDDA